MAVTSTTFDVYKTKIKDIYITPMKNLSTKHTYSFCWTEFGQLVVELNGKRRTVLSEQVFCAVCLRNAKIEDEDVLFSKVQVKAYSKSIATSNLLRHLKDAHGLEDTQKSKISNIKEFFSPRTPKTSDKYGSSKKSDKCSLSRDLALWFARSLMPFDTVDNDAMIDFLKKYNIIVTDADLPSRHNIAREGLEDVYNSMLNYINDFISTQSPRFGALTADMWTDKYRRRNYITCTYHFISEDMTLIKFTLATKEVIMKHTGETIRDEILEVLRSFKIEKKEIYLVTDAGGNMKRAANLLGFDNHLCLGHALHNLVNVNGIENTREIAKILKKCKKIVKHVRYRAPRIEAAASAVQQDLLSAIEEFQEFTEHLEDGDSTDSESETTNEIPETSESASSSRQHLMPPPTIKTSTSTRWHSILMMLKSISNHANRQPINTILAEIGRSDLVLQDAEHETIEALIKFLENFKKIVEVLSSETQPTLNLALVFRSEVKRLLEEASDDEPLVIARLKNNMLEGLESRFPLTDVVVAATLLDCRFHSIKEIDEYMRTKEVTKVSFLSSMIKHRLATEDIHQNLVIDASKSGQSSTDSTSNFLMDLARRHSTTQRDSESAIENECWKYFSTACPEDLEPYGGDVLQYWKDRKTSMPLLYTLARSILNIPATSTPSERVFSTAGLVITAKRSRLNPLRLNRIIFVHDNYGFCKESIK